MDKRFEGKVRMILILFIFFNCILQANNSESFDVINYENNTLNLVRKNLEENVNNNEESENKISLIPIGRTETRYKVKGLEINPEITFKPKRVQGRIEVEEIKIEWYLIDSKDNIINPDNNYMRISSIDGQTTPIEFIKFNEDLNKKNYFSKIYSKTNIFEENINSNYLIVKSYNGNYNTYEDIIKIKKEGIFERIEKFVIDNTNKSNNDFHIQEKFKDFNKNKVAFIKLKELEKEMKNLEETEFYRFSNVNLFDNYSISFPVFLSENALSLQIKQTLKIIVTVKYNKGTHVHTHNIIFGMPNELNNLNLLVIAESSDQPYNLGIKNLENEMEFDNSIVSRLVNGVEVHKLRRRNNKIYISKATNENQELESNLVNNYNFLITKEQNGIIEQIENEQIVFKSLDDQALSHAKFNIKIIKRVGENILTLASSNLRAIIIKGNKIIMPIVKEYKPRYFKFSNKYYGINKIFNIKDFSSDCLITLEDVSLINNSTLKYRLTLPEEDINNFQIFSNSMSKENISEKNSIGSNEYEVASVNYSTQGRKSSVKMLIDSSKISLKNPQIIEIINNKEIEEKRKIIIKGLSVKEDSDGKKEVIFDEINQIDNFENSKEVEVILDTSIEIIEGEIFKFNLPLTYKVRNYYELEYKINKNINFNYIVHEDIKHSKIMFPIITRREEGQEDRVVGYENLINKGLFSYSLDDRLFNFSIYENEKLRIKIDIIAPEVEFPENLPKVSTIKSIEEIKYLDDNEGHLKFNSKNPNESRSFYGIWGTKNKIEISNEGGNVRDKKENNIIYLADKNDRKKCFTIRDGYFKYINNRVKDEIFDNFCSTKIIMDSIFDIEFQKDDFKFNSGYSSTDWDKEEVEIWCHSNEKNSEKENSTDRNAWRAYPLSFSLNRVHLKINDLYFTQVQNSDYSYECFIDGAIFKNQKIYSNPSGTSKEIEVVIRTLSYNDEDLFKNKSYLDNKILFNNYAKEARINEGTLFLFDRDQKIKKELPTNFFSQNIHDKLKIPFMVKVARVERLNFKGQEIKNIYSSKPVGEEIIHGIRKENEQLVELKDNDNANEFLFFLSLEKESNERSKSYTSIRKNIPLRYKLGIAWEYFDTKPKKEGIFKDLYKSERNISFYNSYLVEDTSHEKFLSFLEEITSNDFLDKVKTEHRKINQDLEILKKRYNNDKYKENLLLAEKYLKKFESFSINEEEIEERNKLEEELKNFKNELTKSENFKILRPNLNGTVNTFSNKAANYEGYFKEDLTFEDLDDKITLNEQHANIFIIDFSKECNYNSFFPSVIENNLKILVFPELEENEKVILAAECKLSEMNSEGVEYLSKDKIITRTIPVYVLPEIKSHIVAPESATFKKRIDINIYNDFVHDEFEKEFSNRKYKKKENENPSLKLGENNKYWKIDDKIKSKYDVDPLIYLKELRIFSNEELLSLSNIFKKIIKLKKIDFPTEKESEEYYKSINSLKEEIGKVFKKFFYNFKNFEKAFDISIAEDESHILIYLNENIILKDNSEPFEYIKILLRNFSNSIEDKENQKTRKITNFFPIGVEIKNILIDYDYFRKEIIIESQTGIKLNDRAKRNKNYKFEDIKAEKKIALKINKIRRK